MPAGQARSACLQPTPRRGPRPPASSPSASFAVHDARLTEIDVDLDFPVWGLSLPRARALGSLALGTPGGPLVTFEVRDARAPSGLLRVGPGGAAATVATTTARFDEVLIGHVVVSPEDPADLALEVSRADTGRSRLAGTAVFDNVFARHGKHGEKNPPGMTLDARWDRLADAAARFDAPWLPREALGELLDGALAARVHGPFLALSGTVSLEGQRAGVEAEVERGERATVEARATDLALAPFLHEGLQPLLGGRVSGRLRVKVELAAGLRDADLEIPRADVTLTRDGPNAEPRRLAFRVGTPVRDVPWSEADDTLVLGLKAARLFHRALRVEGLSARWAELSARGTLTLDLPAGATEARVDAKVALAVTSLARWVPPATASARVAAEATLAGPLDHLRARLAFAPSTTATIFGERFRAPAPVTATLDDGNAVSLSGLAITRVGGGRVEFRGRAKRGGAIAGRAAHRQTIRSRRCRGSSSVAMPPALTGGRALSLHDSLTGKLDATLTVGGPLARPAYTGTLDLTGVTLGGRPLGDGHRPCARRAAGRSPSRARSAPRSRSTSARRDGATASRAPRTSSSTAWRSARGFPPRSRGSTSPPRARRASPWRPAPAARDARGARRRGRGQRASHRGRDHGRQGARVGARAPRARGPAPAVGARARRGRRRRHDRRLGNVGGRAGRGHARRRARAHPAAPWVAARGRRGRGRTPRRRPDACARSRPRARGSGRAPLARGRRAGRSRGARALDARAHGQGPPRRGRARAAGAPARARLERSGHDRRSTRARRARRARPSRTGTARLDGVELRPRAAAWPTLRVSGVVEASGHAVSTRALRVEATGDLVQGAVTMGDAGAPATVDLGAAWPLRIARIDAPVVGRGLRVGDAKSPFEIGALDLRLRLAGDPARELVLSGDVGVARARVDPFAGKKKSKSGPARPWFEALPPRLTLDLMVHGPDDALVVDVPVLPDIDLGFRCHVAGSARGGTISGELRGRGGYSRLMLSLFGPKGARECRVLKE